MYIFIPLDCAMVIVTVVAVFVGGDADCGIIPSKSARSNLSRNFCNSDGVNSILSVVRFDVRVMARHARYCYRRQLPIKPK